MNKNTINNRYTIEYVHPSASASPTQKQASKGRLLLILLFTLLLIAGFLFKNENFSNYLQGLISTEEKTPSSDKNESNSTAATMTEDTEGSLVTKGSDDNTLNTDSSENNDLINSLDKLTKQLVAARKKNSGLESKLKEKQSNNDNLSTLLANPINKEESDNKNYLSALQNLEKEKKEEKQQIIQVVSNNKTGKSDSSSAKNTNNDVPYGSNNQTAVVTKNIADSKIVAVELNEKTKKNLNYNNAISLSTKSQIDAIIVAMKTGGITTNRPSKPKSEQKKSSDLLAKNNDLISQISQQVETDVNGGNSTETSNDLISVGLKGKINKLIDSKEFTGSSYQKALNKESKTRSNAVRSVVVKKGETLWSIAKRAYGDGKHYKKILKANPQLTRRRKLFLVIGQVIRVPK